MILTGAGLAMIVIENILEQEKHNEKGDDFISVCSVLYCSERACHECGGYEALLFIYGPVQISECRKSSNKPASFNGISLSVTFITYLSPLISS